MLTVYTEECGLISAMAKSARSIKSRKLAATQQFCYATFVLVERDDRYWVKEATLIESFFGIRETIERLALAGYIAEVVCHVAVAEPDTELLRLALNSLYAVSRGLFEPGKIKAAFEIRLLSIIGFMPEVLACHTCGERSGEFYFNIMAGAIECIACHRKAEKLHETLNDPHESHVIARLTEGAKTAIAYAIYSPIEKLFSFKIPSEDMRLFEKAAELYLLNHLERSFKTLDFYNEVKK
jgi:DNA repair protein RecO (recombination protein O)